MNKVATERAVDFSATLILRAATADAAHGTQISSSASGGTAGNAFNGNIASKWSAELSGSFLQYQWTDSQYRHQQVNKFCLVSAANAPGNEPSAFTLSILNGADWTPAGTYTGVYWTERAQRQCFYLSDPVAIQGMKLEFTAVAAPESTTVELALFDFLEENTDKVLPDLSFSPAAISGIVNVPIEPIAPANPYYEEFSSSPALPAGLEFGSNGAIYGTPTETASGVYTITGISINGEAFNTTVAIDIKQCTGDESLVYVHITDTGSRGYYMGYELVDPVSGTVVGSRSEFDNNALYMYHPYCLGLRNYQITMKDYSRVAWPGSLEILTASKKVLTSFTVGGSVTPKTESFFPREGYSDDLDWRYLMDNTDPVSNWYTSSFDGEWQTSKLADMPAPQYTAAYYCTTFNLYSALPYATMDVTVHTRGGFILYIDDEENARYNLPQGATNHLTQPVTEAEAASGIRISIDMSHISNQNNVLCVETHTISVPEENEFNVEVEFVYTSTDLVVDGTMSASDFGYDDDQWHETNANIFDKSINNKFNVMNQDAMIGTYHVWAAWTYNNNRRVIINYLRFYAGSEAPRRPKNLDLYGSNDNGATWQLLMAQQPTWESGNGYGYNREYTFTNTVAYNMYKLEAYKSNLQGIEMAEVYFGNTKAAEICASQDNYSSAYVGSKAFISCPTGYTGFIYRNCVSTPTGNQLEEEEDNQCTLLPPIAVVYGINNQVTIIYQKQQSFEPTVSGSVESYSVAPELPADLTLDPTTGVISGALQSTQTGNKYTITATNSAGSLQTEISLTSIVVNCEATAEYLATNHGEYSVAVCPEYYTGYAMARCMGGEFEEPSLEHCTPRLSGFFTYGVNSIVLKTNQELTPISLLTDGAFPSISCNKDLPEGLVLGEDGTISGTPTVPSPAADYEITGTNSAESKSVTISITVEDNGCEALDEFPAAMNGATSEAAVCPEGYSGMATRECVNGVFQPINYEGCTLLAPSSFSYSSASMSRDSLEAIRIEPSVSNKVDVFSCPSLPSGLQLLDNGVIAGSIKEADTYTFTVTASNDAGSAQATVTITVTPIGCSGVEGISLADGERYEEPCPENYHGVAYRTCSNGELSILKMDECVLDLPTNLDYKEKEIVVTTNVNYEGLSAMYNGTVESFMISPELPEGMGIASDSGAIYGTSATTLDRTEFVVTASNSAGSTNVTIFLTVEVPHCPAMADFPRTAANESYSYDCTQISGYKGVSERTCVLNQDKASASWAIPTSYCVEDKLDLYFLIGIVLIIIGVVLLVLGILFMVKRDRKTLPKKPASKTTFYLPFLQFHILLLDCNCVFNEWIVGIK